MASALSFTLSKTLPIGPGAKIITGTLVLANTHAVGGDVIDLSSYFSGAVYAGWPIDDFSGYKVDFVAAASFAPATGKVHAWRGDNDAVADSVLITSATVNLAAVTGEYAFIGY